MHTQKNRPWEMLVCIAFKNKAKATAFEKYLKSHAGDKSKQQNDIKIARSRLIQTL